jgi:hypothetical protein
MTGLKPEATQIQLSLRGSPPSPASPPPPLPVVFDRALIAGHLARRPADADDFLTRLVLADLEERLLAVNRRFERALILSPDGQGLPERAASAVGSFAFAHAATIRAAGTAPLVDPEALELPHSDYDLIVSIFDVQVVNDVVGFLARLRAHLRPDGLLLAALPGGATLTELRQAFLEAETALAGSATARVAPFIQLGEVGGLVQRAGLKLPVADVESHVVRYDSMLDLALELKRLGASNPLADRPSRPLTRGLLAAAAANYAALAADPDGRLRATLEIVWLSGWAAHENQQKPLRPGTARVSLRDVLGDKSQH